MIGRNSAARGALLAVLVAASSVHAQQQPQRLSNWLLEQPALPDAYPLGLSWRVPSEEAPQHLLRHEVLELLAAEPRLNGLRQWVSTGWWCVRIAIRFSCQAIPLCCLAGLEA